MEAEREWPIFGVAVYLCRYDVRWLQREITGRDDSEFPEFNDTISVSRVDPHRACPGLMATRRYGADDTKMRIRGPSRMCYAMPMLMILRALIALEQHVLRRGLELHLGFARRIGGYDRSYRAVRRRVNDCGLSSKRYSAREQDGTDQPGVHSVPTIPLTLRPRSATSGSSR